ncbi:F-box only protein 5 [Brachionichthys hirsutus]|uniref:F-box only protein 5 n=1 Tax=Brachionichthys hirsutus TaxID=412623 RepID=UPI003604924E
MLRYKEDSMKYPGYKAAMSNNVEKTASAAAAAANSRLFDLKCSPVKPEPNPIKPPWPPAEVTALSVSLEDNSRAVHNKENSTTRDHDRTLDELFEDSGYLSLQNSQVDDHQGEGEDEEEHVIRKPPGPRPSTAATPQDGVASPNGSPSKCQRTPSAAHPFATPSASHPKKAAKCSVSSTPAVRHRNLPVLMFQRAVCEELSRSYQKNKRYDWSVVSKVAEDHLLDRVIGGQMGLEYVDVFSSLLARNMKSILADVLVLLGDMDLISCRKVSRTWRRIICEDAAAPSRCQRAEDALTESRSSLRKPCGGLTRDLAVSRAVLSCMQTMASSNTSTASCLTPAQSCRVHKKTSSSRRSRFSEYVQAASGLQQHESLRPCRRCGSPATHSTEVQRAICTRASCRFDFCTHCRETFHGSAPCRAIQPRAHLPSSSSRPLVPGSRRSVRRL